MRIDKINQQTNFKAKIHPKLLREAKLCVKNEMQKNFLAKRIKEIGQYGDKNTIISSEGILHRTAGATLSIQGYNPCMPKRKYSPQMLATPLYIAYNCAFRNYALDANAYDVITMITPERVYECEKLFFKDSVRDNRLNPAEELERCKSIVAPDTYKAFQEAAESLK